MTKNSLGRFICMVALLLAGLAGTGIAQAQGAVTGRNATSVSIMERGKPKGEIRKVNATTWIETDTSGAALYQYEEVKRDDSTVHLSDASRDITLQLDLRKRTVMQRNLINQKRDVFQIQSASDGPLQAMPANATLVTEAAPAPSAKPGAPASAKGGKAAKASPPGFCWTDTAVREAGTVPGRLADCPEGYALSGGSCKRPASTVAAPSRAADCPAGYNNTGASCERTAQTKPNPNSRLADCPDGFDNTGGACFRLSAPAPLDMSKMSCKAGESRIESRCYKACEAGFSGAGTQCSRPASTLGGDNLTCKAGFQKNGKTQRCMAVCAAGFNNTGEACVRAADALGPEGMLCKAGETRVDGRCLPAGGACADGEVQQGGLCYKACAPGYEGLGTACLKAAPKTWLACGAGAAKDGAACAAASFDPLTALRQAALQVQAAGSARPGKERAATKARFAELMDAYAKARNLPQFKKGLEAWDQADGGKLAQGARLAVDAMAGAASEDEMVRHGAQLAQIAELGGAGEDGAYPKCATLAPAK